MLAVTGIAQWRTLRIFMSSTFRDMQAERDWLVRFVFPRLREQLIPRRIHLVDVDLRWGVTSEQDALEVCREIIDECHPRFLCILGGRYGWVPPGKTRSITAEEVHYGVLDRELAARSFAYFYFRDESVTAEIMENTPGEYREPQGSQNQKKLNDLKQAIRDAGLNPFVYSARWDNGSGRLTKLNEFGERVYDDLLAGMKSDPVLQDRFAADTSALPSQFVEENAAMETFIEMHCERFVLGSRESLFKKLLSHANATGGIGYVCLTGAPGSGKSALLAYLYRHLAGSVQTSSIITYPFQIIPHFVGASPGSTDLPCTVRRLCHELKASCPNLTADIPVDPERLVISFPDFLRQACEYQRVVIILDAIDQFDSLMQFRGLTWLPENLPANARVILSALDGPALEELRRRSHRPQEIELNLLMATDGEAIVELFCKRYHKAFESNQCVALLAKSDADKPLYLLAALEELRTLGTYEEILGRIAELPPTTHEFFAWILERLESDDGFRDEAGRCVGHRMVPRLVALLGASRHGLSQLELDNLLDPGDPHGNIAALLHLLRPYLKRHGELLDFYHRQFRELVHKKYLYSEDDLLFFHRELVSFFCRKADPTGDRTWTGDYPRGLSELAHHLLEGKQYGYLFTLACDDKFLNLQRLAFPNALQMPLQTVQKAIQAASMTNDATRMAEFCIKHARQVVRIREETPIEAIMAGDLSRAWALADLSEIGLCIVWHLLMIWKLKDMGMLDEARATLGRLLKKELPRLSEEGHPHWWAKCAAYLLRYVPHVNEDALNPMQAKLLGEDESRKLLCNGLAVQGRFAQAAEIAHYLEHDIGRAAVLKEIANAQVEASEKEEADKTFAAAVRIAQELKYSPSRPYELCNIAKAQAAAGKREAARQTFIAAVQTQGSMYPDGHVLRDIALYQVEAGELSEAVETTQKIKDSSIRAVALCGIAKAQAQAGEIAAAISAAMGIEDTLNRSKAHSSIVKAHARVGEITAAIGMAQCIEDASYRAEAFREIARAQLLSGKKAAARAAFVTAIATAKLIKNARFRAEALREIAKAQSVVGKRAARDTFAFAFEAAKEIEDTKHHVEALMEIAKAQWAAGETAVSRKTFASAIETAQGIEDDYFRGSDLSDIAKAQAMAGNIAAAIETAENIKHEWWPAWTLYEISKIQAKAGDIASAIEIAKSIEYIAPRAEGLIYIAQLQDQAGDKVAARRTFAAVLQSAEKSNLNEERAFALREIAKFYAETGNKEAAMRFFSAAIETAYLMIDNGWRAVALRNIAETQAKVAIAYAEARKSAAAIEMARSIEDKWNREDALRSIAIVQIELGNIAGAVESAQMIGDAERRADVLISIANRRIETGKKNAALKTITAVIELSKSIENPYSRVQALIGAAKALVRVGEEVVGEKIFAEAIVAAQKVKIESRAGAIGRIARAQAEAGDSIAAVQTALSIEGEIACTEALRDIAKAQARAGDWEAARETFAVAIKTVPMIRYEDNRKNELWAIAVAQAEVGEDAGAIETANSIGSDTSRAGTLSEIARVQAKAGEIDIAIETAEQIRGENWNSCFSAALESIASALTIADDLPAALETARRIPDYHRCARALCVIATAQIEAGEKKAVNETIAKSMETAGRIKSALSRSETLKRIAEVQAAAGEMEEAMRTFSEAIETAKQIEMLPAPHPLVEIAKAQIRAGLSAEVFKTTTAMLTNRNRFLPEFADALAEAGDRDNFKQLLFPCAYYLDATYKMCGPLARLYPEYAIAIADIILRAR